MDSKRFWVLDELIKIGHLEAAMSHGDEQVCNVNRDMENETEDVKHLEELAKEQDYHREGIRLDYENRVGCENDIMEFLQGNKKDWCYLKHRAAAFVIAAENYHARDCCPTEEKSLILAAKSLALTASHCFGFEMMDCLRCLGDALQDKYGDNHNPLVSTLTIVPPKEGGIVAIRAEEQIDITDKPKKG